MADVKICDRCGKTIAPTTLQKIAYIAYRYSIRDRNHCYSTSFDCDLCSDCGTKLIKFLNGAELREE